MSNFGSNSFVIENANNVEIYEKIMSSFDLCIEFDTRYEIGRVNGKVYTIEKNEYEYSESGVQHIFTVWNCDDYDSGAFGEFIAYSFIEPYMLELKDGNLHISESWCNTGGVVRYYIADVKLYKTANIYFSTSSESYVMGATNDKDGKYFKICFGIYDEDGVGYEGSIIPDNFNELPFEEQLSIYNLVKEQGVYSCYGYTQLIETEEFFG